MKIALIGYGKMGRSIEQVALERGHAISLIADEKIGLGLPHPELKRSDVAIEFTAPGAAVNNIMFCFDARIPVVVGTTGWYNDLEKVKQKCLDMDCALFYASNFSIGVNLFFVLNSLLAGLMNKQPDYDVDIEEIHHKEKLDSPSGTAITLANEIIDGIDRKKKWINEKTSDADLLSISSRRLENVVGTHTIHYASPVDEITIQHNALTRKGFALGAVLAAEWVKEKRGIFQMKNMLNFGR